MTRFMAWKSTAIAAFLGGTCALTSLAAAADTSEGYDPSQKVEFKIGATQLRDGDNITIEEIHGTASTISAGNVYVIQGTYRLGSEGKAQLVASGATNEKHGAEAKEEAEKQRIIREILKEYIADSQKRGSRPAPEVMAILRGMLTAAPMQNTQKIDVERGEGRFSLIYYMWEEGNPRLNFCPADGGESFASVSFQTGR